MNPCEICGEDSRGRTFSAIGSRPDRPGKYTFVPYPVCADCQTKADPPALDQAEARYLAPRGLKSELPWTDSTRTNSEAPDAA